VSCRSTPFPPQKGGEEIQLPKTRIEARSLELFDEIAVRVFVPARLSDVVILQPRTAGQAHLVARGLNDLKENVVLCWMSSSSVGWRATRSAGYRVNR
jgi:hypothetical protein